MKRVSFTQKSSQGGFTIIELLIASLVFSLIMILLTFGVIEITHTYYKGITENKTQNVARNVMNTIGQALQLDGSYAAPSTFPYGGITYSWFCVGSEQFTYAPLGYELTAINPVPPTPPNNWTNYALVETTNCPGGSATSLTSGTELLSPSMRLSNLSITPLTGSDNLYTISLTVTYGDYDVLHNPTGTSPTCLGGSGDQFCTVASLNTVVDNRTAQ